MVPAQVMTTFNVAIQPADAVARSAALFMVDEERTGQVILSRRGKFKECEGTMLKTAVELLGMEEGDNASNPEDSGKMLTAMAKDVKF